MERDNGIRIEQNLEHITGWSTSSEAHTCTHMQDQLTALERFRRQKSKKGNAAEFMGLLQSLTKRW
jgi:hypothetical protein